MKGRAGTTSRTLLKTRGGVSLPLRLFAIGLLRALLRGELPPPREDDAAAARAADLGAPAAGPHAPGSPSLKKRRSSAFPPPAHTPPPPARSKRSSFGSGRKHAAGSMPRDVDVLEASAAFARSIADATEVAAGLSEWAVEVLATQLSFPGPPLDAALAALVEAGHNPCLARLMLRRRLVDLPKLARLPAARPLLLRLCGLL